MPRSSTGSQGQCSSPVDHHGPEPYWRCSFEERCVDPPEEVGQISEARTVRKTNLKDANGRESETIGFIPGSANPVTEAPTCGPCAPRGSCSSFVCSVLTCGLYRVCQRTILAPCLGPGERPPDQPENVSLKAVDAREGQEEDGTGWLEDLRINGVKVDSPTADLNPVTSAPVRDRKQPGHHLSLSEPLAYEDWEGSDEDVDSLITKKLLELYSEYQIDELARCTSDSMFLRKTREINQLINSLAEQHKLDEQEAECRLVRGIIRISTRKSHKRPPQYTRSERTLSDSGNETMKDSDSLSLSNNNDYKSNPKFQISEQTPSDFCVRNMRKSNGGHTSGKTAQSPTRTETNSSGVSLAHTPVRA